MARVDNRFALLLVALLLAAASPAGAGAPAAPPQGGNIGHGQEHQIANLGDFTFDSGETISDFRMSYVTWGEPNEAEDNVIVLLHGLAQDHHSLDFLIGPGLAFDPERYFIIAPDALGNSAVRQVLSTGPTNSFMKMDFPAYTLDDAIRADVRLVRDHLGFDSVLAVIGDSLGAIKSYRLAAAYPDFTAGIVPLAGGPRLDRRASALTGSMMQIIELDPAWYSGRYEVNPLAGLQAAYVNFGTWFFGRGWFEIGYATPEQELAFWRLMHGYMRGHDARDVYYQLRLIADYDGIASLPGFDGNEDAALRSIKARALIIGDVTDVLVDIEMLRHAAATIPDARLLETDSPWGHFICCGSGAEINDPMSREIAAFLASLP